MVEIGIGVFLFLVISFLIFMNIHMVKEYDAGKNIPLPWEKDK